MKKIITLIILAFVFFSCKTIVINLNCNCEKEKDISEPQIIDSFIFPKSIPFDDGISKSPSDLNIQNTPDIKINKK